MPGIGNNLYPPIVSTWMPAFIRSTPCNIYFSLSIYNNIKDIANAQVVVNNQNDNRSALSMEMYPTGVKICDIQTDTSRTDDKYYIQIKPSDLTSGVFNLNQFYKVQIRFTSTEATEAPKTGQIASWLVDNQQYFSEWSTVCLVKGIEKPNIYLKGFEQDNSHSEYELTFTQEIIDLVGRMYYDFNENLEKETLKWYSVHLYNINKNEDVFDSGIIYTNNYNPNEINYTLKVHLEEATKYELIFTYSTINEYKDSIKYIFSVFPNVINSLNAIIEATPDIEYGRMKINVKSITKEIFFGNLTIRRTSSETNFNVWEDVHQTPLTNNKPLDYTWYDYTVESGIWYKYGVQRRNSKGDRGILVIIKNPIIINLDDIFLTRENIQFKVKFDPNITNFKYNLSEVKVDTLGSIYPHFHRNGNIKYKQFTISGLITAWSDEQGIFLNKDNIYNEFKENYKEYNKQEGITEYNDYIYERMFREKIMDFLYADNIKLFRSPTEGNILIKLMDVNLTPNQILGRMLYSFTANAYEIDKCTIDNYEKYGIQTVGNYSNKLIYNYNKIGQINDTFAPNEDLFIKLKNKYEQSTIKDFINKVFKINWLRIECQSDPYLIEESNGKPVKVELTLSHPFNENILEGYIININGQPMVISPRGFIEFVDDDVEITSVSFPYETEVIFDYSVEIGQTENISILYNKIFYYTKAGQLHDVYMPQENIFRKIYTKYLSNIKGYHQELISIDKIIIEAEPGTAVYIKDSFDEDYYRHEIGKTGVLEFYNDEAVINGLYFEGKHLFPIDNLNNQIYEILKETIFHPLKNDIVFLKNENTEIEFNDKYFKYQPGSGIILKENIKIPDEYYLDTGLEIPSLSMIIDPIEHAVYRYNNRRVIYYNGQFYDFNEKDEVQCPIEATIDYIYEYMKGEY